MIRMTQRFAALTALLYTSSLWAFEFSLTGSNPEVIGQYMGSHGTLWSLSAFFILGLLLAFTPCVLPMVPILSGIIVGQQQMQPRRAFILSFSYVMGMALTYAVAGMLAGYLGATVQTLMQQPWVIIAFALVFVGLAGNLFGLFELRLPSRWQPRMAQGQAGVWAAALMGILSTLIVSPCVTAPLIAVLAFITQSGQMWQGGLILFVMALGMGLPLLLVGAGFGSLLPKSGAWMIRVKQGFGILMLLLAVWMVSRLLPAQDNPAIPFQVIHSMAELEARLESTKSKHQAVMVEFFAGWCSDCQAMDKKVFNQPEVLAAMQGIVNLRVDISEKSPAVAAIRQAYGVLGIPTLRFYQADGQPLTQLTSIGQIDKGQMMKLLIAFEQTNHSQSTDPQPSSSSQ